MHLLLLLFMSLILIHIFTVSALVLNKLDKTIFLVKSNSYVMSISKLFRTLLVCLFLTKSNGRYYMFKNTIVY